MMFTSHQLADLKARAAPVMRGCQLVAPGVFPLNARAAANALSGVVKLVAQQQGLSAMQASCAMLCQHDLDDSVSQNHYCASMVIIAAAAKGVALVAGNENVRAALAYWACFCIPGEIANDLAA